MKAPRDHSNKSPWYYPVCLVYRRLRFWIAETWRVKRRERLRAEALKRQEWIALQDEIQKRLRERMQKRRE